MALDSPSTDGCPGGPGQTTAGASVHLLGTAEAAARLHRSQAQLRWWRCRGGGPAWRRLPNGRAAYRVEDLDAWLRGEPTGDEQVLRRVRAVLGAAPAVGADIAVDALRLVVEGA